MGRTPCCDKKGLKKGPWTPEEDDILVKYISKHNGHGSWRSLPKLAGLLRCGKSCRLRWTNYLRPDIKRGPFTREEEKLVIQLHGILGNRWAAIASQLAGRTDNEIKNLWNTHLKKRLIRMGLDPHTHEPFASRSSTDKSPASPTTRHMAQWESARLEAEARLSRESSLFINPTSPQKSGSDFFLKMWNSEVGDSFRKAKKKGGDSSTCLSSVSPASSSAVLSRDVSPNLAASSTQESNQEIETKTCESIAEDYLIKSDSSSSNDLEDSSESALQLLLDFPINNDMSFLEDNNGDFTSALTEGGFIFHL